MSGKLLQIEDYTVPASGILRIPVSGRYFQLMQSLVSVKVEFLKNNSSIGYAESTPEGLEFGPVEEEFNAVVVTAAAATVVKIAIGQAGVRLNRIVGSITAAISKSTVCDDIADAVLNNGAGVTIAALATRRRLVVQADDANTGNLRVGPNAAAGRGMEIGPGQDIPFETTTAIKLWNDSGANQTYRYYWTAD